MRATLRELAERFGCELDGDASRVVTRVATLANADGDAIAFLANPLYKSQLAQTRAAAVILEPRFRGESPVACLVHREPYATFARVATYLHPPRPPAPGIHPSAVVAAGVTVPASAEIGAQVVIGPGCTLGDAAIVGAGTVLGARVAIGAGTRLAARVAVLDDVAIGARCIVHSGAVIGADGFGFAPSADGWVKVPQLGGVVIGDDVEVGANTTIDRGTIEPTVIENGVKIDNLVQIAHNARIGEHTIMAAMSGVAGSTKVGKRCMIGGGVVMIQQLTICDDVMFTFRSVVTRSVTTPGTYSGSLPADEAGRWRRNVARFRQLDALAERLQAVERAHGVSGEVTGSKKSTNKVPRRDKDPHDD
jgi:UDP-3-O-[3-hydroxymyristoyl] glucosamine N-acyltransferase